MPEIKANEALPERPVVIVVFGDPGIGKTSLAATCKNPYTIDFDKGISRASRRGDALLPDNWEEVLEHEKKGTFKKYSTIVIDTAKACLDDFLMTYVVNLDYKNKKNKQAAYGALGDEFKVFLSNRRIDSSDILIIAHSKDREDGDLVKKIPDVTGGSYQLLLRVADQIGFMTTRNNRRIIQWEPGDYSIGKNVAKLPTIEVPDENDPAFRTFMSEIIQQVKSAIVKESDEQREAREHSEAFQARIAVCNSPEELTVLLGEAQSLLPALKLPLMKLIQDKSREKGYVANKELKRFELPAPTIAQSAPAAPATPAANAAPAEQPSASPQTEDPVQQFLTTPYEDRCTALAALGMQMEFDRAAGFGLSFSWEQIGTWTEEQYMETISQVQEAKKKAPAPKKFGRPAAASR